MTPQWSCHSTCHLLMGSNTPVIRWSQYPHTLVVGLVPTLSDSSTRSPGREDLMLRGFLRKVAEWEV